jgi:RHS repeat-associated protein
MKIDDLRIFKKGLTQEEVMTLYTNEAIAPPPPAPNPQEVLAAKSGGYRYGFNGKEKDDELKGAGNSLDFGARIYDSRLGRWLSVDPLFANYSDLSPYNYVANSPLRFIDPDGKLIRLVINGEAFDYNPNRKEHGLHVINKFYEAIEYNMKTHIGQEVWNQLIETDMVIEIQLVKGDSENKYDPAKLGKTAASGTGGNQNETSLGVIYWNYEASLSLSTEQGVDDKDGGIYKGQVSPSTTLIHEAGHAVEAMRALLEGTDAVINFKANQMEGNSFGSDAQYDNKEERRNIVNVEQVYIKQINTIEQQTNGQNAVYQPLRFNHKAVAGKAVKNPNSVSDTNGYKDYRQDSIDKGKRIEHDDGIKD